MFISAMFVEYLILLSSNWRGLPKSARLLQTQGIAEQLTWKEQNVKRVGKVKQEEAMEMLDPPLPLSSVFSVLFICVL